VSKIVDDASAAIAGRIKALRSERGWSLADLSARARVSKAMLSKVERGEASPTAVVLVRIATAFGLTLAALAAPAEAGRPRLVRAGSQPVWRDPKTRYLRRQLFSSAECPLELVDVTLPARATVSFPASAYEFSWHVVVVLDGKLEVREGRLRSELATGDRLEFGAPSDVTFRNRGARACRYLVAVVRR
jgi:transcriptional regulator with XRE-family HTH domain